MAPELTVEVRDGFVCLMSKPDIVRRLTAEQAQLLAAELSAAVTELGAAVGDIRMGNRVRVVRKSTAFKSGDCTWIPEMDALIGREGIVDGFENEDVEVEIGGVPWCFALDSLEIVQ